MMRVLRIIWSIKRSSSRSISRLSKRLSDSDECDGSTLGLRFRSFRDRSDNDSGSTSRLSSDSRQWVQPVHETMSFVVVNQVDWCHWLVCSSWKYDERAPEEHLMRRIVLMLQAKTALIAWFIQIGDPLLVEQNPCWLLRSLCVKSAFPTGNCKIDVFRIQFVIEAHTSIPSNSSIWILMRTYCVVTGAAWLSFLTLWPNRWPTTISAADSERVSPAGRSDHFLMEEFCCEGMSQIVIAIIRVESGFMWLYFWRRCWHAP